MYVIFATRIFYVLRLGTRWAYLRIKVKSFIELVLMHLEALPRYNIAFAGLPKVMLSSCLIHYRSHLYHC